MVFPLKKTPWIKITFLALKAKAEHTQRQNVSVLHKIDPQQCIDCQFSDGIDLLIQGGFIMKSHCRKATHNHCKTGVYTPAETLSGFSSQWNEWYMCLTFVDTDIETLCKGLPELWLVREQSANSRVDTVCANASDCCYKDQHVASPSVIPLQWLDWTQVTTTLSTKTYRFRMKYLSAGKWMITCGQLAKV